MLITYIAVSKYYTEQHKGEAEMFALIDCMDPFLCLIVLMLL